MRLSDFSFELPPELIAQAPIEPRDQARLLVCDRLSDTISHRRVADLPDILPQKSTLVANNSRVRHSRLWANGKVELLLLEPVPEGYRCLVGGKVHDGDMLEIFTDATRKTPTQLRAEILRREDNPAMSTYIIRLSGETDLEGAIERIGEAPLPAYIQGQESRPEQYQTVFAKELGSAAAPTAGLHFTPELLERLRAAGMGWEEVTLHVGLGTFLPLRQDEVEANHLHVEHGYVSPEVAQRLNQTDSPIITIGTTSTRTLESHWRDGKIQSGWQDTDLFIYPGYVFGPENGLLTNFHLPKSSLLMLVAAFLANHPTEHRLIHTPEEAVALLQRLYAEAIKERYRFFSFGDAMLIL